MKPLEKIRQQLYWLLDSLKGSSQKKDLDDVAYIMSHWGEPNVEKKHKAYVKEILDYAVKTIPYYKQFEGYIKLEDFPVINKATIRGHEGQFFSPEYDMDKMFRQETSGSTGVPFVVFQDPRKRRRATADTLFFSKLAHYELGSRLYFSRVWEARTVRSPWTCFKQNWVMHNASNLSDYDLKNLLDTLTKDDSTKSVILFASTLTAIAKYVERENINPTCEIASFITISEALEPWTKQIIEKRFKTPVFSRYSDQELGIMGQHIEGSNEFMVNVASFHIEILDMKEDKPAKVGDEGRIVVTDLFNRAVPLIRYDTGDVAILKSTPTPGIKVPVFEKVGGRRVDYIFDTKGNMVSPYVINTPMHEFLEIRQYQFIQEGAKDYKMLLNLCSNDEFKREDEMVEMLKSFLGKDAVIFVEYVKEIPVLKSGKRKQVVNNYKQV